MSSVESYDIHLGFWTNWSHGKIQGGTITITRQNGNFLIAFLAIFIGAAGKSFWRLGCFMLHRYLSTSEPEDGLHHQRQVILRNSDTAQDGAWRLLMSMFAWRSGRRARRPIWRLLPIIIVAFAVSAAFGVASIFSSNVTNETLNQVLLKGTRCGSINAGKEKDPDKQLSLLMPYWASQTTKFLNYGMQCYTNQTSTDGCNLYIKPRLPLESKCGIPCPFGDNICKSDNDNLLLDTGLLDSREDLGINTATKDRFQMRIVQKCAPFKTQPYVTDHNDTEYGILKRYNYGRTRNVRGVLNFTYELPVSFAFLPDDNSTSANIPRLDYDLGTAVHWATDNETMMADSNRWAPIKPLYLDDADVQLAFLAAPEIRYSAPVNDPWFSARRGASEIHDQRSGTEFASYKQDESLGVMGCTMQVQYCNPNLPEGQRCEPLRGMIDPRATVAVKKIFTSESQFDVLKWADSIWTGEISTISSTLGYAGAAALRARYSLSYGYSGPLPDNQWQLEAEHWSYAMLASLQHTFVRASNGPPETLEIFREPPAADEKVAQQMCTNQKVVSNKYSSFNVLGVSLILVFGLIIIVLDMALEPLVAKLQQRKYSKAKEDDESTDHSKNGGHPLYGASEWAQNNMLQLQRLGHEEAGFGEWSKCDQDVPVTEPGQLLAPLDLRNITHPRLQQTKGTPASSEWEGVVPPRPWAVRRSDTGMDTLIEEAQAEKGGKKFESEDEIQVVVHAVSERTEMRGLGLEVNGQPQNGEEGGRDWRSLR